MHRRVAAAPAENSWERPFRSTQQIPGPQGFRTYCCTECCAAFDSWRLFLSLSLIHI